MSSLTSAERRDLKARSQRLDATVHLGRAGVSPAFLTELETALRDRELVKVRFAGCKEEKKTLAPEIAARSSSELITRVGNVAVYFRAKGDPPEAEED